MFEKSDVLPRYIKYKVDVQTSKLVNDETNMVFSTHKDTANLSTKNHISQTDAINPDVLGNGGWCPWDRLDDSHDDALATAGLTESDVPSLLIAYFKV